MIYTNIYGGLGNQMFQYAIGKNLSIVNQTDFKIDTYKMSDYQLRNFLLSKFNISASIVKNGEVEKFQYNRYIDFVLKKLCQYNIKLSDKIFEKKEFFFDPEVTKIKDGYLFGYWQSFKYFENIRDVLIKEFTLINEFDLENKLIRNQIRESNSVSIHIRRGDYVMDKKNKSIYNVFGIEYYHNAINFISNKVDTPKFFVFSDDLEWASKNLKVSNAVYVDVNTVNNPENDLILMSSCEHNIIANSTFSWWAAWLNQNVNKIVVAPKKWVNNIEYLDDLYPENWIRL